MKANQLSLLRRMPITIPMGGGGGEAAMVLEQKGYCTHTKLTSAGGLCHFVRTDKGDEFIRKVENTDWYKPLPAAYRAKIRS